MQFEYVAANGDAFRVVGTPTVAQSLGRVLEDGHGS